MDSIDELQDELQSMTALVSKMIRAAIDAKISNTFLSTTNPLCCEFTQRMETFTTMLKKNHALKDVEILDAFLKRNMQKLEFLRDLLVKPQYINVYDNDLRVWCKKWSHPFLTTLQWKGAYKRWQTRATSLFTKFCEGITYFKEEMQINRDPIYHRNASCDFLITRSKESNVKFTKWLFQDNKNIVERCYIERLIYNKIWENTIDYQNVPHALELDNVARIFEQHFPYISLNIHVLFWGQVPYRLTIHKKRRLGFNIGIDLEDSTETYTRTILDPNVPTYDSYVACIKSGPGSMFVKNQTFEKYEEWVKATV